MLAWPQTRHRHISQRDTPHQIQDHAVNCRFNSLRLNMFSKDDKGFPCLRGRAGEIRHLAPALRHAFVQFQQRGNRQHEVVVLMLDLAILIGRILDDHADAYTLPAKASKDLHKCLFAWAQLNTELGTFFHPRGALLFNHTIKTHYMLHIGLQAAYINPRLGWCYAGEDLMQRTKKLVQSCHRGTGPHLVTKKALLKYVTGLSSSLSKGRLR